MKKSTIAIIAVAFVAVAIGAWLVFGSPEESDTTTPAPTTSQTLTETVEPETPPVENTETPSVSEEVEIQDYAFNPKTITVKKGTTVTWTNKDDVQHNVVPDDGDSAAFKGGPLLAQGKSYSFTFNTPGTYTYHCGPHPQMTATITVTQ